MLAFLRKIRKSLIESLPAREGTAKQTGGSARKYMLYAIGEILLVMIGILLALNVNNWNSNRLELQALKNNLKYVIEDIEINKENLLALKDFRLNAINSCSQAINAYKSSTPISFSEFLQQYGPIAREVRFKVKREGIERVKASPIYESEPLREIRDNIRAYEILIGENQFTESKLNGHIEDMEKDLFRNGFYDGIWGFLRSEFIDPKSFNQPDEDPDMLKNMNQYGSLVGIFLRYEIESPLIVNEYDRIIAGGGELNAAINKYLSQ